ncbi:MAG: cytochrome c biogenesis protein CcsA [Bacteroidales bacterium]|nr:cytochrome c biogenesis protein CcsA [Bacteroidales bacterium]
MISFILLVLATAAMALLSLAVASGASDALYSSVPMCVLWAIVGASAIVLCVRRKLWKKPALMILHLALLMILIGAAVTHFSGSQGTVHLRIGDAPTSQFIGEGAQESLTFPFKISAVAYQTVYYPATSTPRDFRSIFCIADNDKTEEMVLSVNRTVEWKGYKFILKSVDSDGDGFTLNVRRDVAGTWISFSAYGLLLLGMIMYFFQPYSAFRNALLTLRKIRRGSCAVLMILSFMIIYPSESKAMKIPENVVESFGSLYALHDGRVVTLTSLSADFVSTLTGGHASWQGHEPAEIMAGFLFDFSAWKKAPMIKVKEAELRQILGISGRKASFQDYLKAVNDGRLDISDPSVTGRFAEDILRFETVTRLMTGELLTIYPVKEASATKWLTPASDLPRDMDEGEWLMVKRSLGHINHSVMTHDWNEADKMIGLIADYQRRVTGLDPVSEDMMNLERMYSRLGDALWLAVASLVVGLSFIFVSILYTDSKIRKKKILGLHFVNIAAITAAGLMFLLLTILIGVRWSITGHLPLANGFETMQFMGWLLLGMGFVFSFREFLTAGMSIFGGGLALAVASMSGGALSMGPLMPVLSSPLLSIHVVCVMAAYSLFLMMALSGGTALLISDDMLRKRLTALGHVILIPALFLLAAGIFIGAVWAEMSWGIYWSWDPKEVWALITMLVYSLAVHPSILKIFRNDRFFNIFGVIAFLTVLITFFGVNFFLGGMHSYA